MTAEARTTGPQPDRALAEQLRERLAQLRRELRLGEEQLLELVRQEAALRQQLLRIAGAVQVLAELTGELDPEPQLVGRQPGPPPEQVVLD
ncbi:hypothetical protein ACFW1A_25050 [Kitasatospora sp. NPDC058965]|uniref:hypothetical protein n=1 Tax=Kitasatospora sp. NPDC058965 TaxID=3346682 RepID=UPI0036CC73D0